MTRRETRRFYKSGRWLAVRRYVLARARWRCHSCGLPGSSDVHDRGPLSEDPSLGLDPSKLITLCRRCHCRTDNELQNSGLLPERLSWLRVTGA